eukprot:scaffold61393_cov98-Phaeocystis_antarctica.AAC.3
MLTGANVAFLAVGYRGAYSARATVTRTPIAVSDLGASNATARRRSLAARAQGNTTGTTAHGGGDRLRCQGTCQRR